MPIGIWRLLEQVAVEGAVRLRARRCTRSSMFKELVEMVVELIPFVRLHRFVKAFVLHHLTDASDH